MCSSDLGTDNTTLVGFAMAVGTGASAIASLGSRRFRDRVARRSGADELTTGGYLRVLGMALGLMAVSNVVIAMATGYLWLLPAMVLNGLGLGLVIPTMNIWLTAVVPLKIRARAVGGMVAV